MESSSFSCWVWKEYWMKRVRRKSEGSWTDKSNWKAGTFTNQDVIWSSIELMKGYVFEINRYMVWGIGFKKSTRGGGVWWCGIVGLGRFCFGLVEFDYLNSKGCKGRRCNDRRSGLVGYSWHLPRYGPLLKFGLGKWWEGFGIVLAN